MDIYSTPSKSDRKEVVRRASPVFLLLIYAARTNIRGARRIPFGRWGVAAAWRREKKHRVCTFNLRSGAHGPYGGRRVIAAAGRRRERLIRASRIEIWPGAERWPPRCVSRGVGSARGYNLHNGQSDFVRTAGVVSISAARRLASVLPLRVWCWHAFAPSRLGLAMVSLRVRRFRFACSAFRRIALVCPVVICHKSAKFAAYSCTESVTFRVYRPRRTSIRRARIRRSGAIGQPPPLLVRAGGAIAMGRILPYRAKIASYDFRARNHILYAAQAQGAILSRL